MQPLLLLVQTYCKTIEGVVVTREDGEMAVVGRCESKRSAKGGTT
jgi:hypothetical protein